LGKWIPVAETNPTSLDAHHDPYVLWRQIRYKLYRAIDEENGLNEQLLALQNRCQHYETVIVQAIQKAIKEYAEFVAKKSQYSLTVANEINGITTLHSVLMLAVAMGIPAQKEWDAFQAREPTLLKPDHKPHDPATASFPFSDHPFCKPLLEARLDRKSTLLKRRTSAYYVLTAAGFLFEYKDHDPVLHPDATLSLKLADCELGNPPARSGKPGFTLRGKDAGKSMGMTHEYIFRTDSEQVATQWWEKLEKFVGNAPRGAAAAAGPITESEGEEEKSPVSPTVAGAGTTASAGVAAPGQTATAHTARQTEMPVTTAQTGQVAQTTATPTATATAPTHTTTTAAPAHGVATSTPLDTATTTEAVHPGATTAAHAAATHPATQ